MATGRYHALAVLHSTVLLFALSGLFGKWLLISPIIIVFGRAFFAAITLFIVQGVANTKPIKLSVKLFIGLAISGVLLAFHWLSFFHAIQVSNVATALIAFASFPIFVSFIEPYFKQVKFKVVSLLQAVITVIGIMLVLSGQSMVENALSGIGWGLISAVSFACLTVVNGKFVQQLSAKQVALIQNIFVCLSLTPLLYMVEFTLSGQQLALLLILGVFFTALTHSLFNFALKQLSALLGSIAVSLEPVYGIIAAWFLLSEPLNLFIILGASIVVVVNIWVAKVNQD